MTTITETRGQLDRSERGKLALTGADAASFLQGQVTNDIEGLEPGQGCYAAFLTPKGKMLGDLRVLRTDDELLLDTERVSLQPLFNLIRRFSIGYDVELHKRTVERGLVSVLGHELVPGLPAVEHAHLLREIDGTPVRAIRTDLGTDLLCDAADTERLAAALAARGIERIGEVAAECARIEQGRPRYGIDLDDRVIPQEAGLNERAVSFTKGCYVGQETVARLHYRGKPNRHLRGLRCEAPVQTGDAVTLEAREVGVVGSTTLSPRFGSIALALIRREAPPGSSVLVGGSVAAEVSELPFS